MAKNKEDFTELCASIVELITMLQKEISRHGTDGASGLAEFCEKLERCVSQFVLQESNTNLYSLLREIKQGLEKFQKKGFHARIKEFGRSTSIGDELNRYKNRVHELRLNFIVGSSLPYMSLPSHMFQDFVRCRTKHTWYSYFRSFWPAKLYWNQHEHPLHNFRHLLLLLQ
jgi:hypothetical protein